jgi:hypothetical protein
MLLSGSIAVEMFWGKCDRSFLLNRKDAKETKEEDFFEGAIALF